MSIAATSIKEYINEFQDQSLKMTDFFLFEILSNTNQQEYIKTIEENILARHQSFLEENKVKITITDDEYRKYRCNAHWVSQDIYGTTELWFLILHANELYSESEFTMKEFYVYNKSVMEKLSEILAIEESDFLKNRANIYKQEIEITKK